ncbi:hypothetical protein BKA81DRAFT_410707 [Phyllosticta paracitricarpa]|uniref:Uncharacterized protein n=1 Tax=Phyllosticta paracitricarpa TaxID=2016321 RepID=A0ABR1MUJ8_9PEZI
MHEDNLHEAGPLIPCADSDKHRARRPKELQPEVIIRVAAPMCGAYVAWLTNFGISIAKYCSPDKNRMWTPTPPLQYSRFQDD